VEVLFSEDEVIKILRLDKDRRKRDPFSLLRTLRRRHGLPYIRAGKLRLYPKSALEQWIRQRNQV
jgi:hypothetical protein